MASGNFIRAFYYPSNNFGDNLNNELIKRISKKPCVYHQERDKPHYIVCGSIIQEATEHSTVWGAGLGHTADIEKVNKDANILMVRGKRTAELLEMEFDIYGDPALLTPMFFEGHSRKIHEVSILPHWKDYEYCLTNFYGKIIDPFQPVDKVIYDICASKMVISSSLHGLILSDSYGVPNRWMDFGNEIGGDGIKFRDYYSTTKTEYIEPATDIEQALSECVVSEYYTDKQSLLNSCPFYEKVMCHA